MPVHFRALPAALALAIALPACRADSPTAPVEAPVFANQPLPLHGRCEATSSTVTAFIPPILHQTATAECQLSQLGRVSIVNQQQVNVVTGEQVGHATWRTASGDQLYVASLGVAVPAGGTTLSFTGTATIDGGSGRFRDAEGSAAVEGMVDSATGRGWFTYDGAIAYDASARADR